MQINLYMHTTYKWQEISQGWCCYKGSLAGTPLEKDVLEVRLEACKTKEDIVSLLQEMNGFFAIIWTIKQRTFMAVDHARSFPLFWKTTEGVTQLSDHLDRNTGSPSVWLKNNSLVHTEFTPGHTTLLQGWSQLQAGELLEIKAGICYLHTWFDHHRADQDEQGVKDFQKDFTQLISQQTRRFIQYAKGRTIVIPLSGGYDSRYILAALVKEGYQNIKAFTYGQEDSFEVQIAKKIAKKLSIDWIFVPYNKERLDLFFTKEWENYVDFSSNMVSIPQDQDFFALHYLKEINWLQDDDIISPGYCGDFQAGSYLPGSYFKVPWRKSKSIQSYVFHKFVETGNEALAQLWHSYLPKAIKRTEEEIISELENWALCEYVSKYIVNGVRAYEYFNCDWYLPLWDKEFILFWQTIPNDLRKNRTLYRTSLEGFLFKPLGIYFPEDVLLSQNTHLRDLIGYKWKARLKKLQPSFSKKQMPVDENGFSYLTAAIKERLNNPNLDGDISQNRIVGYWLGRYFRNNRQLNL